MYVHHHCMKLLAQTWGQLTLGQAQQQHCGILGVLAGQNFCSCTSCAGSLGQQVRELKQRKNSIPWSTQWERRGCGESLGRAVEGRGSQAAAPRGLRQALAPSCLWGPWQASSGGINSVYGLLRVYKIVIFTSLFEHSQSLCSACTTGC